MTPAAKWASGIAAFVLSMAAIGAMNDDKASDVTLSTGRQTRSFASVPAASSQEGTSSGKTTESATTETATTETAATQSAETETEAETEAAQASSAGTIVTKTVRVEQRIPFTRRTVKDSSLDQGITKVSKGRTGLRVKTYEYQYQDGELIKRTPISNQVVRKPVQQVTRVGTHVDAPSGGGGSGCDENYSGCVPIASDVDCAGGSGNGPEYVEGPVRVIGDDIYGLDADDDGIGCE